MKKKIGLLFAFIFVLNACVFAQLTLPRDSQRQEIAQTVGDTRIAVVYHRPNVKARKIWGCETKDVVPLANNLYPCLVPYGQVWRTGANENTTIEFSRDVSINGQPLPAGKYGFHAIPGKTEWILIFSKDNNKWGSFSYDEKQDALRVKVSPAKAEMQETLSYDFQNVTPTTAKIAIRWEKIVVPFTVDVGDVFGRNLTLLREAIKNRKAEDARPLNQGAGYIYTFRLKNNYEEALQWLDESIKTGETFGNLQSKARILAEMGKKAEAITTAEKALQVAKKSNLSVNTAELEKLLAEWKAKK
jgi:tetratricopeptide (TPR) repeat protein